MSVTKEGLPREKLERIEAFLNTVKRTGFEEIVFGFFPQAESAPDWKDWREDVYQENWRVVQQIRAILQRVGLRYYIDLLNEGVPFRFQAQLLAYTKRLWKDYSTTFGTEDTVGFSIIPEAGRIEALREIYAEERPALLDVHVYENPEKAIQSTKEALDRVDLGDLPWIIGETFYENQEVLASIRGAAARAQVRIEYILQWPQIKGAACQHVSVVPVRAPASLTAPPGSAPAEPSGPPGRSGDRREDRNRDRAESGMRDRGAEDRQRGDGFDEGEYLRCNPDVDQAVQRGQFRSGRQHYGTFGSREGRRLSC